MRFQSMLLLKMFKSLKICGVAFLMLLCSHTIANAGGASVPFQWAQTPSNTWGTKIYIGIEPGIYTNSSDAGINTTSYTLENLDYNKQYYFSATHYDPALGEESGYAPEVAYTTELVPSITFEELPELDTLVRTYQITLTVPLN